MERSEVSIETGMNSARTIGAQPDDRAGKDRLLGDQLVSRIDRIEQVRTYWLAHLHGEMFIDLDRERCAAWYGRSRILTWREAG
jgi:hypothetical protein